MSMTYILYRFSLLNNDHIFELRFRLSYDKDRLLCKTLYNVVEEINKNIPWKAFANRCMVCFGIVGVKGSCLISGGFFNCHLIEVPVGLLPFKGSIQYIPEFGISLE